MKVEARIMVTIVSASIALVCMVTIGLHEYGKEKTMAEMKSIPVTLEVTHANLVWLPTEDPDGAYVNPMEVASIWNACVVRMEPWALITMRQGQNIQVKGTVKEVYKALNGGEMTPKTQHGSPGVHYDGSTPHER